jgi:pyruvate kinase
VKSLAPKKGINLPESHLQLASLTDEDLKALTFVAKNVDIVSDSYGHQRRVVEEGRVRQRFEQ